MPAGRPRTMVPEKKELIELGEDLVNWIENADPKFPKYFWAEWYTSRGYIRAQWKKMIEKEEFRPYYETAQYHMAKPYVNGTVNPSIAHRFIRLYCPDVKEEENEESAYKEKVKVEVAKELGYTQEQLTKMDDILSQIQELRSANASRNKAESRSNND